MRGRLVHGTVGLGIACSCLLGAPLRAEQASDEVEEITVVGRPPDEAKVRAPSAYLSTIDVPELEAPIESTPELLGQAVGIQVQRLGGLGAFSTISIRGSSANQVPIFLDGVPISQAQDQTVNLSDLPIDSLERIEVYRGTVPVGFGGGGIGGVVNLVSRAPSDTPETELSVAGGSFWTRKVALTHRRRLGDHNLLVHAGYLGSEGDFRYDDDNGTPDNPTDDSRKTRINNDFDSVGLLVKTSSPVSPRLDLDFLQEAYYREQGVPGPGVVQFERPSLLTARSLSYLRLRGSRLFDDAVDADVKLFGVYNLQRFKDPDGDFGARQDTKNHTALFGLNSAGTWYPHPQHAFSWFVQVSYEHFFPNNETNRPTASKDGPDQSRLSVTAALQDEITLFDDRLSLLPGVRYEYLHDRVGGTNLANVPNTPAESEDHDLWSPSLGVIARPAPTVAPWLSLRGNIALLERAPSFSELFGNSGSTVGNADLKPESATNRDIGCRGEWIEPDELEWIDRAHVEYAYFYNDIRDLIAFDEVSPGKFRAFNLDSARITGHELSVGFEVLDHAGVELNYTYQDSENRRIDSPEGNQLPLRPENELFARPRIFGDWGSLYYELTYIDENPTDRDNFSIVPSRTIHSVGGTWTPLPWLTAKLEVANLADEDVRDLGDFPLPGISVFGGVTAEF